MHRRGRLLIVLAATAACNQLLGVDEDYEVGALGPSGGGAGAGATGSATPSGTTNTGAGTGTAVGGAPIGGGPQGGATPTGTGAGTATGTGEGGAPQILFTEDFSSGDWPAADWHTEWLGSNSSVSVSGGEGELHFGTANPAWARATCLQAPVADADVTLRFRFNDAGTEGQFRTWLRASGSFNNDVHPVSAYSVLITNSSGTMSLARTTAGSAQELAAGSWTAQPDTATYHLRFQVRGTQIRARVWPDGQGEPAGWTLESTDSQVTGTGDLRLAYVKVSSARWVYVDDIVLSAW